MKRLRTKRTKERTESRESGHSKQTIPRKGQEYLGWLNAGELARGRAGGSGWLLGEGLLGGATQRKSQEETIRFSVTCRWSRDRGRKGKSVGRLTMKLQIRKKGEVLGMVRCPRALLNADGVRTIKVGNIMWTKPCKSKESDTKIRR